MEYAEGSMIGLMEEIARRAVYIQHGGICPECGGLLDSETARCTTPARHDPVMLKGDEK